MNQKKRYNANWLMAGFLFSLMLPIAILTYTEKNPLWVAVAGVLLPLGFYNAFASLSRRSGVMVWWGFIFIFFSAFQIVLSYLFGNSVVATDMFLNLTTTNPSEAGELLGNIYPSVIAVCVIYLPLLWFASEQIKRKVVVPDTTRKVLLCSGLLFFAAGLVALFVGCRGEVKRVLRDEVFPVNVSYNMCLAISESRHVSNFEATSEGFSYQAERVAQSDKREVYVLVIGEASRAASWQLYGYERQTNPLLSKRQDITLFRNVITQSNTTHKSVPMILSSVATDEHAELYCRSGLPALFNEAGFTTYFISNQAPQGAMIDNLAHDAQHVIYLEPRSYDGELLEEMKKALAQDNSQRMLFILHHYGSHFSYYHRYPREYAVFQPDDDVAISAKNMELIRNSYDNSVLYTDKVLNDVIDYLATRKDCCSAMYYCADHGEDLFDKRDKRFLHASPTVTYYQLHVASLAWFSEEYRQLFPEKVQAARNNYMAPATTHSVFHTMADMASIASPYFKPQVSLLSSEFDFGAERYYLNDHNRAVGIDEEIGIDAMQQDLFARAGVPLR